MGFVYPVASGRFFSFPLFSGRCRAASGVLHFPGRGIAWENAGRGPGGKRPAEKGRLGTCCEKAGRRPHPRGVRGILHLFQKRPAPQRRGHHPLHRPDARPLQRSGRRLRAYGIYPEYKNLYALHVFYQGKQAKDVCEAFINEHFDVVNLSKIPTRKTPKIKDEPLIWRYFVEPLHTKLAEKPAGRGHLVSPVRHPGELPD